MFTNACGPVFPAARVSSTVALVQSFVSPVPAVPPVMSELKFPIRAAFYYPWFPEAWNQPGMNPFTHYQPDLGFYNQDDLTVVQQQITAMQYGKIQAGIASWWGQGTPTDKRIPNLMKLGEQMGFYWALYAESEGVGNPTISAIQSDLEYIRDHFSRSPAYLKISGRFVVFVYAEPGDGCDMVNRWTQANTVGAYLVLKTFAAYRKCAIQPDSWHQYAPANAEVQSQRYSYTISPGFWKATEAAPRLVRDSAQWSSEIKAMIAAKTDFQLITTFNEWGEGTAVESASAWSSPSHYGIYLDALHDDGNLPQAVRIPGSYSFVTPQ